MRKYELTLDLKQGVDGLEVFTYFKRLESVVKRYFKNVTDFRCEKKHHENKVRMSFFSCGTDYPKTVNLLFDEKSI